MFLFSYRGLLVVGLLPGEMTKNVLVGNLI